MGANDGKTIDSHLTWALCELWTRLALQHNCERPINVWEDVVDRYWVRAQASPELDRQRMATSRPSLFVGSSDDIQEWTSSKLWRPDTKRAWLAIPGRESVQS